MTLFLFHKVLYILNIFLQLFMLNKLLGTPYNMFGLEVLQGMVKPDHHWIESGRIAFPRVTMCDFNVRRLGNLHRYAVQCTLPLNLFNEKIYVFLWFWFVFVLICSFLGFFTWLIRMLLPNDRLIFIQNHLNNLSRLHDNHEIKLSKLFVMDYLGQDGVFILRLISHNTNNITTEIICNIWDNWRDKFANLPSANSTEKLPLDDTDEDSSPEPMLPSAPLDSPGYKEPKEKPL